MAKDDRPRDRIKLSLSDADTAKIREIVTAFERRMKEAGVTAKLEPSDLVRQWIEERIAKELAALKR